MLDNNDPAHSGLKQQLEVTERDLKGEEDLLRQVVAGLKASGAVTDPDQLLGILTTTLTLMRETRAQHNQIIEKIDNLHRQIFSECPSGPGPASLVLAYKTDNTAEVARGNPQWQSQYIDFSKDSEELTHRPIPGDVATYGEMSLHWTAPPDQLREGQTVTLTLSGDCTRVPKAGSGANLVLRAPPAIFGASPSEGANLFVGHPDCKHQEQQVKLSPSAINATKDTDQEYVIDIGVPNVWISYHYKIQR
jgi:hypothetical protein